MRVNLLTKRFEGSNMQPLPRAEAEALALDALAWLGGDTDLTVRFLATTGAEPADLRAGGAEALAAVLDFLLADEAALLAFCERAGLPPETPARARSALPGGDLPHWT